MKKKYLKICLIVTTIIYSCNDDRSLVGIYSTENTTNTTDTLILKKEGVYERILRRKSDNSLVFKNKSTWYFSETDDRVELSDYLFDNDEEYKRRKNNNYFDDVLMNTSLPLYIENGKAIIIIDGNSNLRYIKRSN